MGSNDHVHIVKGKRTKRPRPSSPFAAVDMATSNSWSGGGDGGGAAAAAAAGDGHNSYQSPTTSVELYDTTEEEEDMANCLILLAQGHSLDNSRQFEDDGGLMERLTGRRLTQGPTATANKTGLYVYQCKTCSRCFNSFQALGGHRASHKKPKGVLGDKKTLMLLEDDIQFNNGSPSLNLQMSNRPPSYPNKSKVHECSICGAEFSSGQALGGHMRRHRSSTTASMANITAVMDTIPTGEYQESKKPRTSLSLDLNLPAPEEDRDAKFSFASKQQQSLVFSASSLVDCHY